MCIFFSFSYGSFILLIYQSFVVLLSIVLISLIPNIQRFCHTLKKDVILSDFPFKGNSDFWNNKQCVITDASLTPLDQREKQQGF